MTWAQTDLGIYGSGLVGVMGGLIHHIEDSGVVVFEISKTDFFADSKTPVYLAYNPNDSATNYLGQTIESGESVLA
jgi:hypothetical protein